MPDIKHIEELSQLVYVPGQWQCKECGFVLTKSAITPNGVFADAREDIKGCPNDGLQMFPVTWKDEATAMAERAIEQMQARQERIDHIANLEAEVVTLRKQLAEAEAAYATIYKAMAVLDPDDFTQEECRLIEGAADALNWIANPETDLASIFRANLARLEKLAAESEAK